MTKTDWELYKDLLDFVEHHPALFRDGTFRMLLTAEDDIRESQDLRNQLANAEQGNKAMNALWRDMRYAKETAEARVKEMEGEIEGMNIDHTEAR